MQSTPDLAASIAEHTELQVPCPNESNESTSMCLQNSQVSNSNLIAVPSDSPDPFKRSSFGSFRDSSYKVLAPEYFLKISKKFYLFFCQTLETKRKLSHREEANHERHAHDNARREYHSAGGLAEDQRQPQELGETVRHTEARHNASVQERQNESGPVGRHHHTQLVSAAGATEQEARLLLQAFPSHGEVDLGEQGTRWRDLH